MTSKSHIESTYGRGIERVGPRAWRYPAALAIVLLFTLAAIALHLTFGTAQLSMVLLAGVLVSAVWLGLQPALLSALSAFFVFNFFLEDDRFELQLASTEDVIILFVFLWAALLTGGLAGQVSNQAQRAAIRAATADTLYRASQEFTSTWKESAIRELLIHKVAEAAAGQAAVWADRHFQFHPPEVAQNEGEFNDLHLISLNFDQSSAGAFSAHEWWGRNGWRTQLLSVDAPELGFVAWRSNEAQEAQALSADTHRLISVLVDIGASAIVRARLGAENAEMEAGKRTEQLRQALLSSVSHDFRTPLSVILVSATTLRDLNGVLDPDVRVDLLATIEEEARRLNRFVANLLRMTRLEAGAMTVNAAPVDMVEVVDHCAQRFAGRLNGRKILRRDEGGDFTVRGDPVLLDHALSNIIENALRFSPEASTVTLNVLQADNNVAVVVQDQGPGVAGAELSKIFGKFYQSPSNIARAQGSGLGLSITRGLIEALGGTVSATNAHGRGLRVEITLPRLAT